ncbi:hypothetical protein [Candidatus Frankia alpina]|uniref:Uncharacterized protein n=1 Tax=Candidatus Frankia alpina TaxID=2699483 RepID=A0A4S5ER73_9ACTN|nr:hypothetical protein [Candidatus Frankia alpina]THJ74937.1 hypothetical protein E7Y31_08450 [Candidatus Frankia alpina]
MIRISMTVLRDLALTAGALGVAAMAAQELDRLTRPGAAELPPTRHGWLRTLDGMSGDRARRLRPATDVEAAASAASRAAGDGGWIALAGSRILPLTDPQVLARAGQYSATERIEVAYVDADGQAAELARGLSAAAVEVVRQHRAAAAAWVARVLDPTPADAIAAGELLDEDDALLDEDETGLVQGDDVDGTDHTDVPAGETSADYADSSI